jgi:Double-GTPase 2
VSENGPAPVEDELPGEELADDGEGEPSGELVSQKVITNDRALLLSETEDLAARHGLTVVLVAGEVDCGKTTLLVAVWNTLMQYGAIGDTKFSGSRTALGFERRAWLSRFTSQGDQPDTQRTREQDNGFVHLRLCRDERLHEVVFSDVAGETFKRVRQGSPFRTEINWLARTNHSLILVDGEAVASNANRSTALSNSRRLIAQLGKAEIPSRLAVVLAKSDRISEEVRPKWEAEAQVLLQLAQKVDKHAVLLETAARPSGGSEPEGVEPLINHILSTPTPSVVAPPGAGRSGRMIGRVK